MPLFQHSVTKKYSAGLDKPALNTAFKKFSAFFHDPERQKNIREAKEEQFQEGFLRELFVNVLGYVLNPDPGYNLTTEHRNVKDSRKADGAILFNGEVVGVIELKGADTTDLAKVENQAFGYKNNQPGCRYVIISNFEKLRFYIDNAIDHLEFNLFALDAKGFELLWLCLACDNLKSGLPARIMEESLSRETEITRALYKDYSLFKRELHQNLTALNPQFDPLTLFKKSQKLLSRLLFLFFAEDRNLLPPNSVRLVLNDWRDLKERDAEVPLYDRFKKYFGYLNTGYKGKRYDVFAYNGGLFRPDLILDAVAIDDELLYRHALKLSEYDFVSEIDVNILGHIFENSLNELEEIRAQLEGTTVDKAKTKRKKEGVYYTPRYITKYIVENTVGRLCREKREEVGIVDEDYTDAVRRQTRTRQALLDKLNAYRDWLLQLTICDPACGSGAFLNQALEFLIAEHRSVDELQARLFGDAMVLSDLDKSILENNLYGVDLNEESVEIARLSLWLRTARPNRTLNDLSNNIKVGNSLIDDPAVAGDKAFDWLKEFPHVFAKGGFDVVIGNPPYVQSNSLSKDVKNALYKKYSTAEYQINTYGIFVERTIEILKDKAIYGLIIPNYWISAKYDLKLRRHVFVQNQVFEIINLYQVFEEANVDTLIIIGSKSYEAAFPKETSIKSVSRHLKSIEDRLYAVSQGIWSKSESHLINSDNCDINISFRDTLAIQGGFTLKDFCDAYKGMQPYEEGKGTPAQTREMMVNKVYHAEKKKDESYYPLIGASNVQYYEILPSREFIKYGNNLAAPRKFKIFSNPRLLVTRILSKERIDVCYTDVLIINNTDVFNILLKEGVEISLLVFLSILGSKLCSSYFKGVNVNLDRSAFPKINVNNLLDFPIPEQIMTLDQEPYIEYSSNLLSLKKQMHSLTSSFHRTLQRHFGLAEIPAKLNSWYQMGYGDFVKELRKRKLLFTLAQEAEWEGYFEAEAAKALELKRTIDATDREIDRMVYELYGLTEEEIAVVEGREATMETMD